MNIDNQVININIMGTVDNPLFQTNQIGELLGLYNIRKSIMKLDENDKVLMKIPSQGGMQNTSFITEYGLYDLILMSRKPFAKAFKRCVFDILHELRTAGIVKVNKENQLLQSKINSIEAARTNGITMRHNILIKSFHQKHCIYIGKVEEIENNVTIVKIGNTHDIKCRYSGLAKEFDQFAFLDVFECERHVTFELFLHGHNVIREHKFKVGTSKETYKLSDKMKYADLLDIVNKNIKDYRGLTSEMKLEEKKLKIREMELEAQRDFRNQDFNVSDGQTFQDILQRIEESVRVFTQKYQDLDQKVQESLVVKEENVKIEENNVIKDCDIVTHNLHAPPQMKKITNPRGPKVQLYDKDKQYVKTFGSIIEAIRGIPGSQCGIKEAVKNNTMYRGYRLGYIDQNQPDDHFVNIPDTQPCRKVNSGLVAMLNIDRNKIVEVFPDQKIASEKRQMSNGAAINKAIINGSRSSGHFFEMWNDCDDELKDAFLLENKLPALSKRAGSKSIEQINVTTGEVIETYNSINNVLMKYQMSRITLYKSINNNEEAKGFKWRQV